MTDEEIRIIGYAYMIGYQKGKEDLANTVKNRIESEYNDTDCIKQRYVLQFINSALDKGKKDLEYT